jgi:hypothetical protein
VWSSTLIKIMSSLFTARSSHRGPLRPTWSLARGYLVIVANRWSARRRIAYAADISRVMKTSFSNRENQHAKATSGTVRVRFTHADRLRKHVRSAQVGAEY